MSIRHLIFRCAIFFHRWQKHGPTQHMAIQNGQWIGWQRYWFVCADCGLKRHGERMPSVHLGGKPE